MRLLHAVVATRPSQRGAGDANYPGASFPCLQEGQCGLGTPLEELARQQRQQWEVGAIMPWSPNAAASGMAAAAGGGGAAAATAQQRAAAAAAAFGGQPSFEQQQFERCELGGGRCV